MKSLLRVSFATVVLLLVPCIGFATSAADIVKAQKILQKVVELTAKYQAYSATLQAPAPIASNSGRFMIPYDAQGQMTEWANKTLSVQLGAAAGEKAGSVAGKAVASKVPFGGLASGMIKNKGKSLGAMAAVGGPEFVKQSSQLSFNSLEDYAVYLHVTHASSSDYARALAAAMAIYPELEKSYDSSIKNAFQQAAKRSAKTDD